MTLSFCLTNRVSAARPLPVLLACILASSAAAEAPARPATVSAPAAASFPVTVESCGRKVTLDAPPRRAVAHGSNLIEIMMALGLQDQMLGYTGRAPDADALHGVPDSLPQIQRDSPTIELLLDRAPDFVFAGWSYGMRVGGEVTPETLGRYDIPVYELSESCIRLGQKEPPSFDYLFRDLRNLSALFGVPERGAALVAGYQARLDALPQPDPASRPLVFVYDSGDAVPVTAGGFAMPQAIIEAAGGRNLAGDLDSNWTRIDWEAVAERNPYAVVVVDYGPVSGAEKVAFMKKKPGLSHLTAVQQDRFLILPYDALTPGPRNIDAAETLARFLRQD